MLGRGYANSSMEVSRVFHWAEFKRGRRENRVSYEIHHLGRRNYRVVSDSELVYMLASGEPFTNAKLKGLEHGPVVSVDNKVPIVRQCPRRSGGY